MAINPIPSGRTAPVDANGVLSKLIKQPYDNQPTEDESGLHLQEAWKGPYDKIKSVLSHISTGMSQTDIRSTLNSYVGVSEEFATPTCPTRLGTAYTWVCRSIRAEELEAGAHGMLYITYDGKAGSDSTALQDDPYQDIWSMSWQAYSVDPYFFLSNAPSEPYPCSPSFDTDPENALPPADHWTKFGNRAHIDKYLNGIGESKSVQNKMYYYYAPDAGSTDYRLFLNGAEGAVLQKKLLGRSATWHYPVLTHQTVKRGKVLSADYTDQVGNEIDHIADISSLNCPYSFPPSAWTFVKIGDDMTQVKTREGVVFTRRETYAGFSDVDQNFYGNGTFQHNEGGILSGRWEPQSL